MTVEIQGVQGYEYQYLATIYISLFYIKKESVEIYVENTEDAKIIFEEDATPKELNIQVKKHNASITFDNVCSWLGHFGEHQSENFLLSRITEKNCFAMFVSNGRCEDKASQLINNEVYEYGNKAIFNNQYAESVKTSLLNQYNDNTPLNTKRKKCIIDFFNAHSTNEIKASLKKIGIVEQITLENLLKQISDILNKGFVVRLVSVDYVMKLLDECVRKGRDSGEDIAPIIRSILNKYSQKILPDSIDYTEVPDQKTYESILDEKSILLLTGVPFCGKTSLAKAIAQSHAQQGYEVKQTSEFEGDDGALAFFNNYTDDKRLLLFEDPFGSVELKPDKVERVQKIRKLIMEKIPFDRKLIITTRKDILFTAFDMSTIDDCAVNNNCWWDQTMSDIDFAHLIWNKLYGCELASSNYFEQIKNWIEINESGIFLEVGEISNLKMLYSSISELEKISVDNAITDARISSKIIMEKVKMSGADSIRAFLSLGFCCNTMRTVLLDDLAYVLSNAEERPSLIQRAKDAIRCVSTGGRKTVEVPCFPQYSQKYKIQSNQLSWLQQFERQGYIFKNKLSNEICFAHPIFYFASKLLLLDELKNQWECAETLFLGFHAIGALNKHVNLCALDILWYCIENDCCFQEDVLIVVINSLKSIFPATKEKAILLLEKYFQNLTVEQQEDLVKAISEYEFDKYLLWNNNEPFINPSDEIELDWDFESILGTDSPVNIEEIKRIKKRQELSPQCVHNILNSRLDDDLPLGFLNMTLLFDESIIREKAIYLIFKNHGRHFNDANIYLRDFDNCNVIFALFRGALQSWFTYSKNNRDLIVNYFVLQLQRVSVAMQAKNFLENFGDDYHEYSLRWDNYNDEQTTELWKVWCTVFTEFLNKFPPQYLRMDEAHMEHTMDQVVGFVNDAGILLNLFSAWNTWLTKSFCPNDYGMCLMEKLLRYIPATTDGREQLFLEMVRVKDTSIITSHIKHIVDNWEYVAQDEKQKLEEVFSSKRNDVAWIKAVALTRKSVPIEIHNSLFGEDIFNKSMSEVVMILRNEHLLEPCLNIHSGYPNPLWRNGYHHGDCAVWDMIIAEVLKGELLDQPFEISLREFMDCEYNYEHRFDKTNSDIWKSLLSNQYKKQRTFFWLIRVSSCAQTNKELWNKYFNSCNSEEKKLAYTKIADFIEVLQYYQNGDAGILKLFDRTIFFKDIYPLFENDLCIENLCDFTLTLHNGTKEFIEESAQHEQLQKNLKLFELGIETFYDQNPPRMQLTNAIVKSTMRKIHLTSDHLEDILEKRRCELIDIACEKKKLLDDHYELANWNFRY